jgi:hypothetical protein
MPPDAANRAIPIVRWIARSWSIGLFAVWGAFFVEHLAWVAQPDHLPPTPVLALLALHLGMLVSLVVAWRWETVGGAGLLVTSLSFFSRVAGANFVAFAAVTALPALMWMWCGVRSRDEKRLREGLRTS